MNRRNLIAGIAALPLLALPGGEPASAEVVHDEKFEQFIRLYYRALDTAQYHVDQYLKKYDASWRGARFGFNVHISVDSQYWPNHIQNGFGGTLSGPNYSVNVRLYRGAPYNPRPVKMQSMSVWTGRGVIDEYAFF